jgi:hypothetical protein
MLWYGWSMISPIETVSSVSESEVMLAFIDPENYAGKLVKYGEFEPYELMDEYEKGRATIYGRTFVEGVKFQTNLSISYPGLISRAIAKIRGSEPKANIYLTMFEDPSKDIYTSYYTKHDLPRRVGPREPETIAV